MIITKQRGQMEGKSADRKILNYRHTKSVTKLKLTKFCNDWVLDLGWEFGPFARQRP
jgi:hypothetical protein